MILCRKCGTARQATDDITWCRKIKLFALQITTARIQAHSIYLILLIANRSIQYFIIQQCAKGTYCHVSMATINTFMLISATSTPTTIKRERIVAFPAIMVKCGDFLTSSKPVSFSRRTLHHGVSMVMRRRQNVSL